MGESPRDVLSEARLREIGEADPSGSLLRTLSIYFTQLGPENLKKAREALQLQDVQEYRASVHRLKNVFLNVGLTEGVSICRELEADKEIQGIDAARGSLDRLEGLFVVAQQELARRCGVSP